MRRVVRRNTENKDSLIPVHPMGENGGSPRGVDVSEWKRLVDLKLEELHHGVQVAQTVQQQINAEVTGHREILHDLSNRGSHKGPLGDFKIPKPPSFSGVGGNHSPTQWLQKVEKYLELARVRPSEYMTVVGTLMEDQAYGWWQRESHGWLSWEDFKAAFLRYYQPVQATQTGRDRLLNLRQGRRTVREYRDDFIRYASEVPDMTDAEGYSLFRQGLAENIRKHMLLMKPSNLAEAMEDAQWVEETIGGTKPVYQGFRPAYRNKFSNTRVRFGGMGAAPMELGMREDDLCYRCGERGHYARECPHRSRSDEGNRYGRPYRSDQQSNRYPSRNPGNGGSKYDRGKDPRHKRVPERQKTHKSPSYRRAEESSDFETDLTSGSDVSEDEQCQKPKRVTWSSSCPHSTGRKSGQPHQE